MGLAMLDLDFVTVRVWLDMFSHQTRLVQRVIQIAVKLGV
jgi:hypothetical protein